MAVAHLLYGIYGWALFTLLAPPTWICTALAPHPAAAWRVNRLAARIILKLAGIPFTVSGIDNLPRTPCVMVANHCSYMDGIALFAALPTPFSFVAKREFLNHTLARIYLQALGAQFVERFDTRQSIEDAQGLANQVKAGTSLGFFPESTFRRMSGLASFRLGAFAAAAGQVAVLPVAIRGSRALLRDGQWLPRRGAIAVTIGSPVFSPAGAPDTFTAAVSMRDAARAHILAHCGEPDVGAG
jgi:1-acyl-sn-glycerol-3-phosphate acyltransferase